MVQELEIVLTKMEASFIADVKFLTVLLISRYGCRAVRILSRIDDKHKQGHIIQESNARAVQMLDSFMAVIAQMIVATSTNHSERMAASMQALVLEGVAVVHELHKVLDVTFGLCQGTLERNNLQTVIWAADVPCCLSFALLIILSLLADAIISDLQAAREK